MYSFWAEFLLLRRNAEQKTNQWYHFFVLPSELSVMPFGSVRQLLGSR